MHAEGGSVTAHQIGIVNVGSGRAAVRSAYRKQVELRKLAAYCTEPGRGPYAWWQAPAWAGK